GGEHQEARRAVAALQRVVLHERALQGMQLVAAREARGGADLLALRLHGEHQAGARRLVVDEHGARAADAVLAAGMRLQRVGQRAARLELQRALRSVDFEPYLHACSSARPTTARTTSRR